MILVCLIVLNACVLYILDLHEYMCVYTHMLLVHTNMQTPTRTHTHTHARKHEHARVHTHNHTIAHLHVCVFTPYIFFNAVQ